LAFSYWIDYLGFITKRKLAAVLITPSLGVSNWSVIYIINAAPLAASTLRMWQGIRPFGPRRGRCRGRVGG
jgi:hypothetical protein